MKRLWGDYVDYRNERIGELKDFIKAERAAEKAGQTIEGSKPRSPLTWETYAKFRGKFLRGMEFQRRVTKALRGQFKQLRIEDEVAVESPKTKAINKARRDAIAIDPDGEGTRPAPTRADQLASDRNALRRWLDKLEKDPHVESDAPRRTCGRDLAAVPRDAAPDGILLRATTRLTNWERVPDLLRSLAKLSEPLYGFAHCGADFYLGSDPHTSSARAPYDVYEPYWLSIYGKAMVDKLGRETVAATPAAHVEWIAGDAAMIRIGQTPVDYATHDARRMQAAAMVHLRGVAFDPELARLEERSRKLAPVAPTWRAEVDDLFSEVLNRAGRTGRATETQRLNALSVPEPLEWRPAAQQLAADIDVAKALDRYATYAEQLVALLHTKVADVGKNLPEVLPQIDHELWLYDYPTHAERRDIENDLVPAVGGYLGQMLVDRLGGRWVPRRTLDESQVVLGDRAWLPFLRARHYLASRDSILTHSLTLFFRVARATPK